MKIIVVGTGGVGGYFGAKLAKAGKNVTFIARGNHLKAIQDAGLTIDSEIDGKWQVNVNASDTLDNHHTADLVLVCVKSYDTETATELVKPVVDSDTMVLSLQNGIDNEDKIAGALSPSNVMGGVAYIFANIVSPGIIQHHQLGKIVFGELDGSRSERALKLEQTFHSAGIDADVVEDISRILWQKFVFLVALSGTTAVTRTPVGVIRETPETFELWQNQVDELLSLADAESVKFNGGTREKFSGLLDSLAPGNYSSLYHDLINGKRLELSALHGHAVALGKRHKIATPTLSAVYGALRPYLDGPPEL